MSTIILDAMGGDDYPIVNLLGAKLAIEELSTSIILVGQKSMLESEIKKIPNWPYDKISIVDAPEVVSMCESPTKSFRQKKASSIQVGLKMVKEGKADAFVSAGNTGAVLTASTLILGRIDGIERPTLASIFPSEKGHFIMVDMGSNVDCKPMHLFQFAIMGSHYASAVLKTKFPKIGLLNVGEEKDKGNQLTQQTYELIDQSSLNFIGNIEGRDLTKGNANVVVCDGFVGNVVLKFGEGLVSSIKDMLKQEAKKSIFALIGLYLLKPVLKTFKDRFDKDEYGGAQLLGINGVSIISHGSANQYAIKNAIKTAHIAIEDNLNSKIKQAIKENTCITDTVSIENNKTAT